MVGGGGAGDVRGAARGLAAGKPHCALSAPLIAPTFPPASSPHPRPRPPTPPHQGHDLPEVVHHLLQARRHGVLEGEGQGGNRVARVQPWE
jgi:hypothetical protein